jgi:aspartate/methionine/tyrosine aminotransferase
MLAALEGPWEPVDAMVAEFARRRDVIVDGLNAIEGITCQQPGGAFYVFSNVTALGVPAPQVADHFLNVAGVAATSGTAFGRHGEGYVRFSYANSVDAIQTALKSIEASLPSLGA